MPYRNMIYLLGRGSVENEYNGPLGVGLGGGGRNGTRISFQPCCWSSALVDKGLNIYSVHAKNNYAALNVT